MLYTSVLGSIGPGLLWNYAPDAAAVGAGIGARGPRSRDGSSPLRCAGQARACRLWGPRRMTRLNSWEQCMSKLVDQRARYLHVVRSEPAAARTAETAHCGGNDGGVMLRIQVTTEVRMPAAWPGRR